MVGFAYATCFGKQMLTRAYAIEFLAQVGKNCLRGLGAVKKTAWALAWLNRSSFCFLLEPSWSHDACTIFWSLQAPDSLAKSISLCDVYVNPKALGDAEIVSLSSSLLAKSLAGKGSA